MRTKFRKGFIFNTLKTGSFLMTQNEERNYRELNKGYAFVNCCSEGKIVMLIGIIFVQKTGRPKLCLTILSISLVHV